MFWLTTLPVFKIVSYRSSYRRCSVNSFGWLSKSYSFKPNLSRLDTKVSFTQWMDNPLDYKEISTKIKVKSVDQINSQQTRMGLEGSV